MSIAQKITGVLILAAACGDDKSMTIGESTAPTSMTTASSATMTNPTTFDTQDGTTANASDGTSSTSMTETSSAPTTGMSSAPTTGTSSVEGGPIFLSFGTNVGTLTQGEMVTFTATLTDPDGVEDIIGGSLQSPDESLQFGPFVAAGQLGTYSITLSWAQIHQAEAIEFEMGGIQREFRAVFFDQAGHKATEDVVLELVCIGGAACAGTCTDLAVDALNCGACGRTCDDGEDACESGACLPTFGSCVAYDDGIETCAEACLAAGEMCVTQGCGGGATAMFFNTSNDCDFGIGVVYSMAPCEEMHVWAPNAMAIRCCCTDTK